MHTNYQVLRTTQLRELDEIIILSHAAPKDGRALAYIPPPVSPRDASFSAMVFMSSSMCDGRPAYFLADAAS